MEQGQEGQDELLTWEMAVGTTSSRVSSTSDSNTCRRHVSPRQARPARLFAQQSTPKTQNQSHVAFARSQH